MWFYVLYHIVYPLYLVPVPSRFASFRRFRVTSFSWYEILHSVPSSNRYTSVSASSFFRRMPRTPIAPFFFSVTSAAGKRKKNPSVVCSTICWFSVTIWIFTTSLPG